MLLVHFIVGDFAVHRLPLVLATVPAGTALAHVHETLPELLQSEESGLVVVHFFFRHLLLKLHLGVPLDLLLVLVALHLVAFDVLQDVRGCQA